MERLSAHVIAGGTHFHVRPHLALSAPAYGATGRALAEALEARGVNVTLHLTKMAGGSAELDTNEDVAALVARIVNDPSARLVFMPVALCDFTGAILQDGQPTASGKMESRLASAEGDKLLSLHTATKIIRMIRRERKDIFLVGFKTTAGLGHVDQFEKGLALLKGASCNLVLGNDVHTRRCMILTPEEAAYHVTFNRAEALQNLVEMAILRAQLTFTRSTVVEGAPIAWSSELVPSSLRKVVDHCIARGAYKPFMGVTVGHFAVSLGEGRFLTSRRKTNFNRIDEVGLVLVEARGDDRVIAFGARPSVGGQSQRIVFREHPECDCIVHFHCPLKPGSEVPIRPQRAFECGSHECGKNTSGGLRAFDDVLAVMLDRHGPNIVFSSAIDPMKVIHFIEAHFDLSSSTRLAGTDVGTHVGPHAPTITGLAAETPKGLDSRASA